MKAFKAAGHTYKSASSFARELLVNAGDVISDSDIARMTNLTPQTIYAIKMKASGQK